MKKASRVFTASCTAQPGSCSCRQSEKRHSGAQFENVRKCLGNTAACCPNANFPEPGVVDHECPALQDEELADGRCMPPFPVIVPDDGGFLDWLVQQPVYQRGLADTGGTDEYDRGAGEKERFEPQDPFTTEGTDGNYRDTGMRPE